MRIASSSRVGHVAPQVHAARLPSVALRQTGSLAFRSRRFGPGGGYRERMIRIEMLLPAAADDPVLVADISALVNQAYEVAEAGFWHRGVARTTLTETSDAITAGEVVVARDHGRLVGSMRTRQLDKETGWFGVLAVDHADGRRGIGGELIAFSESRALSAGARRMQLELLVPVQAHAHTDRLASWYGRLGYRETERRDLADVEPTAVPFLAISCDVAIMRKHLAAAIA